MVSNTTFHLFQKYPELITHISTKKDGNMLTKDRKISVRKVKQYLKSRYADTRDVVVMGQVHGNDVRLIQKKQTSKITQTDGLLTKEKNIFLGVVTADCLPIIFYDPVQKSIGVCHAGYKGLLRGIIQVEVNKLKEMGTKSDQLLVGIGPAIGTCCYDVTEDRIAEFQKRHPTLIDFFIKKDGKYFLDLKIIAVQFLRALGIKETNIEIIPICTKSQNDLFYSYRGDTPESFGDFVTLIGLTA